MAITMPPKVTDSKSPSKEDQSQDTQESVSPEKRTPSEPKRIPVEIVVTLETSKTVSVPEDDQKEDTVNNAKGAVVSTS